jgi:hypothetical protein
MYIYSADLVGVVSRKVQLGPSSTRAKKRAASKFEAAL